MTLGEKLSDLRRKAGLTQNEVAEKLGVTPQAVSKWESDGSCPDIFTLPLLADLYSTTVDDILSRESIPTVTFIKENERKNFDDMMLRILVDDDGDKVKINIPLPLVKAGLALGTQFGMNIGKADLSQIDFSSIIDLVESGAVGRIVEIEGNGGESVIIEVE